MSMNGDNISVPMNGNQEKPQEVTTTGVVTDDSSRLESSSSNTASTSIPVSTDDVEAQRSNNNVSNNNDMPVLDPPLSCTEDFRDALLRFLDHKYFQWLGLVVLILIIADGALFFFLLMGWQRLCDTPSKTDCDPRNWWYNFSIQFLNVLFTYMALMSMPWRCTQFLHISGYSCPKRNHTLGYDLFGLETKEIWYHMPRGRRLGITMCLLLNCVTQFANQATRIVYYRYSTQDSSPGNIWTNVFFASSMIFAGIGGAWMLWEEQGLHRQYPNTFPPSVIMLIQGYWKQYCGHWRICRCCCGLDEEEEGHAEEEEDRVHFTDMVEPVDRISTPHHEHVLPVERTNARFWAL